MIFQVVLVLGFVASSYQRTPAETQAWFFGVAMECNKDFNISPEELLMMKKHKIPDSDKAKCLMACLYKKVKWVDDQGNFDYDTSMDWVNKEYKDEPKYLEGSKKIFDICKSVNDVTVTDGAKGCERSYHLSKCLTENASSMGLLIPMQYN